MAILESRMGVSSHYFFLLRSPLYNVLEKETYQSIHQIHELGHKIGLHFDEHTNPHSSRALDRRVMDDFALRKKIYPFAQSLVSFHNPKQALKRRPRMKYTSTYDPLFFPPHTKYVSDSNQNVREADLLLSISQKRWSRIQMLIHPLWWLAEKKSPVAILKKIIQGRHLEIDKYLKRSNKVWNRYRRQSNGVS